VDLAAVRVHQDAASARLADAYGARAFTFGGHVFAGRRARDLQGAAGAAVLAHELEHVAQTRLNPALGTVVLRLPEADVVTRLQSTLAANDKPGFFQVLRDEDGAHAGSAVVRGALEGHLNAGRITAPEAWRAVALQLLGGEARWQLRIRNFVEALESGAFNAPAGMPPPSANGLREVAIRTAHAAAEGTAGFEGYRAAFNSLWSTPPFNVLNTGFDPALTSRGPRTPRSRGIFLDIYSSDPAVRTAYDSDPVFRERVDNYVGPDATNPAASARVQALRAVFRALAAPIASANPADPAYVAFKAQVTTAAQRLDGNDRAAVDMSHQWRRVIDAAVIDPALRADITETIQMAWRAVAPPAAAVAAPAGPPIALTPDQQAFASGLLLQGPPTPMTSDQAQETLRFTPASTRDPAGLTLRSRVTLAPAGLVVGSPVSEQPWPPADAAGTPHEPQVRVDGGAAGFTDFTASLTVVPPTGSITHVSPTATVRVVDGRQAWFTANVQHGLTFTDQNVEHPWTPASAPAYYGGQQALSVSPSLPSDNPGVPVFVQGRISRGGVVLQSFPRVEFEDTSSRHVGSVTVLESSPPRAAPDAMELVLEFFPSAAAGAAAFHTITQPFTIAPGGPFTNAQVLAQARLDYNELNATTPGSLLPVMTATGGQAARVAAAIQNNVIKLEPFLVRADSASFIRNNPALGSPATDAAYLMGHAAVDRRHTMVASSGADAWRWPSFPDSVFVNLTASLAAPGTKRPVPELMGLVMHEAVHVVDVRPGSGSDLERYKGEFRAYWMDGQFDTHLSEFDPGMRGRGPKSPKARAIFEHMYGSPTYPFVLPAYDRNVGGFRDAVDAYVVPDGINLIVSTQLERLRAMIEGYRGARFARHRARVQALFAAASPEERREIAGNRAWRDLVERKYAGAERTAMMTDLGIPR
jgi:hypothetical protein